MGCIGCMGAIGFMGCIGCMGAIGLGFSEITGYPPAGGGGCWCPGFFCCWAKEGGLEKEGGALEVVTGFKEKGGGAAISTAGGLKAGGSLRVKGEEVPVVSSGVVLFSSVMVISLVFVF